MNSKLSFKKDLEISIGAYLSERNLIFAPILFSGSAILSIGLDESEASPFKIHSLPVPAMYPVNNLIPVPEFPRSKIIFLSLSENSFTAFKVLFMSSPIVSLLKSRPRIAHLCAIDLSTGNSITSNIYLLFLLRNPDFLYCLKRFHPTNLYLILISVIFLLNCPQINVCNQFFLPQEFFYR